MWTKISRNPVVGYTGRRGPYHKYSLAGAKSSPVDSPGRFSSYRSLSDTVFQPNFQYLGGSSIRAGCSVWSWSPVFMCSAFGSQGAFRWTLCLLIHLTAPHWFMQSDLHQDWAGEYFTAKYLPAGPLTFVPLHCQIPRLVSKNIFPSFVFEFLGGRSASSGKYCYGHD